MSDLPINPLESFKRRNPHLYQVFSRDDGPADAVSAGREIAALHGPILKWAREQQPKVAAMYCRPDRASGAVEGQPDFALCWNGMVVLIEAKTKAGKLSDKQTVWHHLAAMRGVQVHIIRSMTQFYELVNDGQQPPQARD